MEVKAIGKYGRFAPIGEATNAYLFITKNNRKFMIDFGAGALAKALEYVKVSELDAIILTHLHYDHMSDMGILGYYAAYYGIENLKVYAPITPIAATHMLESLNFCLEVLNADTNFTLDNVEFTFAPSVHPIETYAVKLKFGGNTLVYTSDVSDKKVLTENVAGADYVIGDACILEKDYKVGSPHIGVKTLAKAVGDSTKLYLAHLDKDNECEVLKEALTAHKNTELIKDFRIFE